MSGEKLLVGLTCPSCGGQVTLEEGQSLVCCQFCGSYFALDAQGDAGKLIYKSEVSEEAAVSSVMNWMRKGGKAKNLSEIAVISEVIPVYLPFWRLIARGKACVCGYNEEHTDHGTKKIPHESLINHEYVYSNIACDSGDLGIKVIKIPANAKAISFDSVDVPVFNVTVSQSEGYETGYNAIIKQAISDGRKKMTHITFSKGFCLPRGFSLIYYPFYIIRYGYMERNYIATVDGITGKVVSGRAPGNANRQSWFAGLSAISGTIAGSGIGLTVVHMTNTHFQNLVDDPTIVLLIGALAISVFILIFCWKQFRNGGEVITGEHKGRGIKDGKTFSGAESVLSDMHDYFH